MSSFGILTKMKQREYKKHIKILLNELEAKKIIRSIGKIRQFPDEPKLFLYGSVFNSVKKFFEDSTYVAEGFGASFSSRYEALLKCLCEGIERFCLGCYKNSMIVRARFTDLRQEALDPSEYTKDPLTRKNTFGWVKGFNLTKNVSCLVPAQLVYLRYIISSMQKPREVILTDINSTGAAFGFDHESTLLRAVYEVVERDAFMTTYLTKTSPKRVAIEKIKRKLSVSANKTITLILQKAKRYNLEIMLFDITNDIGIPSFLATTIDRTGLGLSFALGIKASLSMEDGILGSLREAFAGTTWLRTLLIESKTRISKIDPAKIHTVAERGLYWAPLSMLKHLDFLFHQPPKDITITPFRYTNAKEELNVVERMLGQRNMEIFYADITLANFRNLGYFVYKAIIPRLQMLNLDEAIRVIQHDRLKATAAYFGRKSYIINTLPQPFL